MTAASYEPGRNALMLTELRLPTIGRLWPEFAERSDKESWPATRWDNVFPDPGMTVAAIDRLVHHSTIFELHKVESYQGKQAARDQKIQRDNDKKELRKRQSSSDNHPKEHPQ